MSEGFESDAVEFFDGDAAELDTAELAEERVPFRRCDAGALFGDYSVLSPGVEIVLDGRPVSAPAAG